MSRKFGAMCCHPEAGIWPKDRVVEERLDFCCGIFRAKVTRRVKG